MPVQAEAQQTVGQVDLKQVQSLQLSLSTPFLSHPGEQSQAKVTFLDSARQQLNGQASLRWHSSRPDLFQVDENGLITALQTSGSAEIWVEIPDSTLQARLQVEMVSNQGLCGSDICSGGGGGGGGGGGAVFSPPSNAGEQAPDPPTAGRQESGTNGTLGALRWSDPATWESFGSHKPQVGENVTIPAGQTVLLDESTPDLAALNIDGELILAEAQTLELQADYIMLHGTLRAGSAQNPYTGHATVTLNAANSAESIHNMGTRGILSMGGRLELFGRAPQTPWTRLNAHLPARGNQMQVLSAQGWQPGDHLVLAPSDFYGTTQTESLQIAAVQGENVALQQGPEVSRWGQLQYLGPQGMSLTPTGFVPQNPGTPTVLDERAAVGNLTRNIVIQGADDALWQNEGFGGQVMIMGSESVTRIQGVELRRMGQSGRMGRYPIHFHLLSYSASGQEIPSGGVREIRQNAIWNSSNRCITIHGTNDTTVDQNICYNIAGHAVFLEDAVERRNTISNNLVLNIRRPARLLINSDMPQFQRGPSGFWLTNPDNTVRGNLAADAEGNGFWLAFPTAPLGLNKNVPIRPNRLPMGIFDDNTSHSNGSVGIQLDFVPFNDAGDTQPQSYAPSSDGGAAGPYSNWVRAAFRDISTYKNRDSGLWNRVTTPDYQRWISADNLGVFFAGAGADGNISHSLLVGESLNNVQRWQSQHSEWQAAVGMQPPVAFASYHSTFNLHHNTIVNFPYVANQSSGAFKTDDYYISPVDKGLVRNPNNQLIQSHPGYRSPLRLQENWALAGALWDPHGYWGPAGNFWVYDLPFLTEGQNCQPVAPQGENGLSCDGEYYGVDNFVVDNSEPYRSMMPIQVTRFRADNSTIGTWFVGNGEQATRLGNMRHFAALRNSRYLLDFPGEPVPNQRVELTVTNAYRPEDQFLLGIRFSGANVPQVSVGPVYGARSRYLRAAASFNEVENGDGTVFWQDTANQVIWVKMRTPLAQQALPVGTPPSDEVLYQHYRLFIEN